jgi:hypothetical protein
MSARGVVAIIFALAVGAAFIWLLATTARQ